MRSTKSIFPY